MISNHFSSLQRGKVWLSLSEKVIDSIVRDMTRIQKELRQMDGKILQVKQGDTNGGFCISTGGISDVNLAHREQ